MALFPQWQLRVLSMHFNYVSYPSYLAVLPERGLTLGNHECLKLETCNCNVKTHENTTQSYLGFSSDDRCADPAAAMVLQGGETRA